MQTLDLSGTSKKTDGRLKSLFWPTVENAWDMDSLGQQGFWICLIIGLISLIVVAIQASEIPNHAQGVVTLVVGVIAFFVYFAGGIGVRQASWPAALLVFVVYVFNYLASGGLPGVIPLIVAAILLANVRATILASQWKPAAEDEDRPMRFNETWRDKLVDQLPPRAWPILKYPFYFFATMILLMLLAAFGARLLHRGVSQAPVDNPATTVTADPSDE